MFWHTSVIQALEGWSQELSGSVRPAWATQQDASSKAKQSKV